MEEKVKSELFIRKTNEKFSKFLALMKMTKQMCE